MQEQLNKSIYLYELYVCLRLTRGLEISLATLVVALHNSKCMRSSFPGSYGSVVVLVIKLILCMYVLRSDPVVLVSLYYLVLVVAVGAAFVWLFTVVVDPIGIDDLQSCRDRCRAEQFKQKM